MKEGESYNCLSILPVGGLGCGVVRGDPGGPSEGDRAEDGRDRGS